MTGGLKIGVWQPDFDFQLRSKDLAEIDKLADEGGSFAAIGMRFNFSDRLQLNRLNLSGSVSPA